MTFTHIHVRYKKRKEQQGIKEYLGRGQTVARSIITTIEIFISVFFIIWQVIKRRLRGGRQYGAKIIQDCKQSTGLNSKGTRGCVCNMASCSLRHTQAILT